VGSWPDEWLIQVLLDRSAIHQEDLDVMVAAPQRTAWLSCTRTGVATDESILDALSASFAIPAADLGEIDPEAHSFLSEEFARAHSVAPLRLNARVLEVATSDPTSPSLQTDIGFASGRRTRLFLVSPAQLDELLERLYGRRGMSESLMSGLNPGVISRDTCASESSEGDATVVKLVEVVIAQAIRDSATDIYFDPDPLGVIVRMRVDGVLRDMQRLPPGIAVPLVARLKAMAALDMAERLKPQDGRAEADIDGQRVRLLIGTLPVRGRGETAAIRIVGSASVQPAAHSC
jgi:type IV pilus assembly protein PilB